MWARFALASVLVLGCGDGNTAGEALGRGRAPIVNGTNDAADPAVVALTVQGQAFCTGTLIRPDVVLTAAHCLPPNTADFGLTSYTQISAFFGQSVGSGELVAAIDGYTDPLWTDDGFEHDVGLLRLADAGPATPIPYGTTALSFSDQGSTVRLVGFGVTQDGGFDSGQKREGNSTILEVFDPIFTINLDPSITCSGDSGGPTLLLRDGQEEVAGIHSRSDCASGAVETRVDAYADAIATFLAEVENEPQCFADEQCASGCGAPDPDCPCEADTFCDAACTTPELDPDCQPDCSADFVCNALCTPATDPDCPLGEMPCTGDECSWVAGGAEDHDADGEILTDGCSVSRTGSTPRRGAWLATVLAALAAFGLRGRARGRTGA